MKKTHLTATSVLLGVLLVTGMAHAESAKTVAQPAASAVTQDTKKPGVPMRNQAMFETMKKVHDENKALFEDLDAKRKELQTIARAEKFDKSAYLAKHQEIEALRTKLATARGNATADALEKMTPQERASMPMGRGLRYGAGKRGGGMMRGNGPGKGAWGGGVAAPDVGQPDEPAGE